MTTEYMSTAQISQEIKEKLQKAAPLCKWSVTKGQGGNSITVALMAAPFSVFDADQPSEYGAPDGYAQLNHYSFREYNAYAVESYGYISNGVRLTEEAWNVLKLADEIGNERNWDKSDISTDYFNCNYYFSLHVGKWDKPFVQLAPQNPATITATVQTPTGVTITQERDWLWIRFAAKPADEVIARLRELGAQWSKKREAWYITDASRAGDLAAMAA